MPFFRGYENNSSPLPLPELEGRHRADWILWGGVLLGLLALILWLRGGIWTWHAILQAFVRLWHLITFWFHPVRSFYALGWPHTLFQSLHLPQPARPASAQGSGVLPAGAAPRSAHPWHLLWPIGLSVASALPLGFAALVLSRILSRWHRARSMQWVEIQLFQHDESTPAAVTAVLDAIYAATRVRSTWLNTAELYRWALGEPPWTLQIIRDPIHATMPHGIHLVLAIPGDRARRSIENALRTTYTNLRFERWPLPMSRRFPYVVRWSLRKRGPLRLVRLLSNYDTIPLETLIQALARDTFGKDGAPAFVFQWTLTPVPIDRARRRLERRINYAQWENFATEQQGARQAMTQIGHGRFRTEWRLAAENWEAVQKAAGAWAAENRQAELRLRIVLIWKGLWLRWMAAGLPGLWPWTRAIPLWSGELASFIALPTGRLRVADLYRSMTRRMPASQRLNRRPECAIMRAEPNDPVGLWEEDRSNNILIRGIQGAGKSQALLQAFRADVLAVRPGTAPDPRRVDPTTAARGTPLKAVVLIDIGKDTAQAGLRLTPPDRDVLWVDPTRWDNPWQMQPFAGVADRATRTAQILELLLNVFGEEAIRDRSKHLLRMFIATAMEADPQASFSTVYRMMSDGTVRDRLQRRCEDPMLRLFWDQEFPALLKKNPRFLEEAMEAPRNKLGALIYHPHVRAALAGDLGNPQDLADQWIRTLIDWDRVLRDRQVVILNLPKADLGDEGVRLLGTTAVLSLWNAIERQAHLPEADRVACSLIIDEAQNFISRGFAKMLEEGRALGLQLTLAVRFLGEIADEQAQEAIEQLCHHLIAFRVRKVEEAKTLMHLMQRLYANNITFSEDVQALTNFAVDDFLHLPNHHAICFWQAHGEVQPAFVAESMPWRPLPANARWDAEHERWAAEHLQRQPQPLPNAAQSPTDPEAAPDPDAPPDPATSLDPDAPLPNPWGAAANATPPGDTAAGPDAAPIPSDSEAWATWLTDQGHPAAFAMTLHHWMAAQPAGTVSGHAMLRALAHAPPDVWDSPLRWLAWANTTWPPREFHPS